MRMCLLVLAIGACSSKHQARSDAAFDTFGCPSQDGICNVLTQTGCCTGEKCTWVLDDGPVGHIGCVPQGALQPGDACALSLQSTLGSLYDGCTGGAYCQDGTCRDICDEGGGSPHCGSGFGCKNFDGVLGPAGMVPFAGLCVPTCNPLDDNDFLASGSKPGSACTSTQGCYALPDDYPPTVWTCEPELAPTLVHLSPVARPTENACAQGYEPLYTDAEGSTQVVCVALCAPRDCYLGNCASPAGAEPHACNGSDARGTFGSADECVYSWLLELDATGTHVPSATSNTVGFCVDPARFARPPCNTLPLGSAAMYGCVSTTLAGIPRPNAVRSLSIRLGAAPR